MQEEAFREMTTEWAGPDTKLEKSKACPVMGLGKMVGQALKQSCSVID